MQRFSRRNLLGWISGAGALAISAGLHIGIFNRYVLAAMAAAALVVVAYLVFRGAEQRRHAQRLQEFAATHGWAYSASGGAVAAGLAGFPFGTGSARTATDLVEGTYSGLKCAAYMYTFEQRVGDEASVEQVFSITQAVLPVPLPRLDLIPETMGSRVLSAVGMADIDLESAQFNRTWRVQSADKRYAVDVVDPRMMHLLLNLHLRGVAVRIDGTRVIAWSAGIADMKDFSRRFDLVAGVANRIPAHVMRKYDEEDRARRELAAERERNAPTWANTGGVLNSGRYTGIGVDADGDGVTDWDQRSR